MTDENVQAAYEEAESIASTIPNLLERLADSLGASAGASAVFGDPVEQEGRTVIPVAQMIIGTGAGGAGAADSAESGLGAGGGALTKPIGYIEVTADGATFVPLKRPWADAPLVLAYSLLALVVLRTLVRLVHLVRG